MATDPAENGADTRSAEARCRSCGRQGLDLFLDFGMMPPSDGILTEEQLAGPELMFPLEVAFCPDCTLVQILETVDPDVLFGRGFPYFSSFSPALLEHSRENALDLIDQRGLGPRSFVIEVASNDGYLLRNFVEAGIPVLGIDPAEAQVLAAREAGVDSLCAFFDRRLAGQLLDEGKTADVIIANNVLAHVADTHGFIAGLADLVKESGVIVIEVPYIRHLIEQCEFDTIYLEHLCYFSVTALDRMFRAHGLFLNNLERLDIHGGSLRLYVEPYEQVQSIVRTHLAAETADGLDDFSYYRDFAIRVADLCTRLRDLLARLKAEGHRLAAYGAAAKGSMLLNHLGVGRETLDFVVDRNIHKHGKYLPGVHVPVRAPEELLEQMPDEVLLLPWNFKDEILAQQADYLERGGRFVIPIPEPIVVGSSAPARR